MRGAASTFASLRLRASRRLTLAEQSASSNARSTPFAPAASKIRMTVSWPLSTAIDSAVGRTVVASAAPARTAAAAVGLEGRPGKDGLDGLASLATLAQRLFAIAPPPDEGPGDARALGFTALFATPTGATPGLTAVAPPSVPPSASMLSHCALISASALPLEGATTSDAAASSAGVPSAAAGAPGEAGPAAANAAAADSTAGCRISSSRLVCAARIVITASRRPCWCAGALAITVSTSAVAFWGPSTASSAAPASIKFRNAAGPFSARWAVAVAVVAAVLRASEQARFAVAVAGSRPH